MRSRIENLGDYNKAREAVQATGGSLEALYKRVGDTAVSKATPKILFKGGVIGAAVLSVVYSGYKGVCFLMHRKQKIENEPTLKKEFIEAIQKDASKSNNEKIENDDIL